MTTQRVTRQELDELLAKSPDDGLELLPACHDGAGVHVGYKAGFLELRCMKCGRPMFDVAVREAPGRAPEAA